MRAFVLLSILATACSAPGRFVIRVDQSEIQRRINRRFPIVKQKLVFKVVLKRPKVVLNPDTDRVEIGLQVVGALGDAEVGRTSATISGGVRYQQDGAVFVLTDPRLESLDMQRMPARFEEPARRALNRFMAEVLPAIPLYRLRKDKHRVARVLLKRAWISDGKLHLEMGL